jgi:hypothetical protein
VFFTFSYAENFDPHLHELLGLRRNADKITIKRAIRAQPHIVNEFFVKKMELFMEHYMIKKFRCVPEHEGWYWYRYEFQHRGAIHTHRLFKFGSTHTIIPSNCVETFQLALEAIRGHTLTHLIKTEPDTYNALTKKQKKDIAYEIVAGTEAETNLIVATDILQCNDMDCRYDEYRPYTIRWAPCPMALKVTEAMELDNKAQDIEDLRVTLQRHLCSATKCQKTFKREDGTTYQQCKLRMPRNPRETTNVTYRISVNKHNKHLK